MKKLLLFALLLISKTSFCQHYVSDVFVSSGVGGNNIIKCDMIIDITDSSVSIHEPNKEAKPTYYIVSKGLNNNFKLSDGVKDCSLTIVTFPTPYKLKGSRYKSSLYFELGTTNIAYYCEKAE